MTDTRDQARSRRDQAAPAGDLGQRRLPHDRHPDPARVGAPHRGARRPFDRARPRRRDRQRQRRARGGPARLRRRRASTTFPPCSTARGSVPRPRASRSTFVDGDAEALPFEDGSFDVVASVFGAMFAPDQEQTASELARVCRRGGRIGLVAHTPDGFIGQLFKTIATPRPAARRAALADPVGHRGAPSGALRRRRWPRSPPRSGTSSSATDRPRRSSSTGGATTARRSRRSTRSAKPVARRSRQTCSS